MRLSKVIDISILGWSLNTLGELDHKIVKAPYIRLVSYTFGNYGDIVYSYDLRILQPNKNYIKAKVLHSFEHFLLYGFRKYMKEIFISVSPMGCQTGFYLILLNEGRSKKLFDIYSKILNDILNSYTIPYANENNCGRFLYHDLDGTKKLSKMLLNCESIWNKVL